MSQSLFLTAAWSRRQSECSSTESKLNVTSANDLDDAAQKIVAAVKKAA